MDDPIDEDNPMPSIVIVGIGGGGSRIVSDGIDKILTYKNVDRYSCLIKALRANEEEPHVFIVDTSADPTRKGFFQNIPEKQKISLSAAVKGMSRGAGGRPGRAAKAITNDEVVQNLTDNLYKPISEMKPAIVVIIHTADGGTGGGLTPEVLRHLGYAVPASTIFWVFTVLPRRTSLSLQGPRTVAPVLGKILRVSRKISERDYTQIPYTCRTIIDNAIDKRSEDQSYEFQHSRIALFPLSNHHFAQCWEGMSRKEVREEVLNPFPIELLSQALYPFLKYTVADESQQMWMQENWPLGPIDIPDIMAGLTPERPFVVPHLYVDPEIYNEGSVNLVMNELIEGRIRLEEMEQPEGETENELMGLFKFTGSCANLYEFRATSVYCVPVYPDGSEYFDEFSDFVSDDWFPRLAGNLKYISGRDGQKMGVISHAANLKPQPIPSAAPGMDLGFKNGMLVTLLFGGVPIDFPVWLEAAREVVESYKTEDLWEIDGYDANKYLKELSTYIGWSDWPFQKNFDFRANKLK